jgi:hypothetical protein
LRPPRLAVAISCIMSCRSILVECVKTLPNPPTATNPAMTARCHAETQLRRFVDQNRWQHIIL